MPAKIPVISLLVFVLVHFPKYCPIPSIPIGINRTKLNIKGISMKNAISNAIKYPINIPVQRAQIGNCFPL